MKPEEDEVIRFEDVGVRYGGGPAVLSGLSFALNAGSFHFLTGPSGAGKTSLLRLMYMAHRPSGGRIHLFGRDLATIKRREMPALKRRIGVVFQDFALLDHLTAFENVALPLRLARRPEAEITAEVEELLRWVGLADAMEARPPTLSGGQQQRIAIARAVIARPDLLVADEPTGSVDDRIAMRILYLFEELNRFGTAVVIATHNHALIRRFRHPRLHLDGGRLQRMEARIGPEDEA